MCNICIGYLKSSLAPIQYWYYASTFVWKCCVYNRCCLKNLFRYLTKIIKKSRIYEYFFYFFMERGQNEGVNFFFWTNLNYQNYVTIFPLKAMRMSFPPGSWNMSISKNEAVEYKWSKISACIDSYSAQAVVLVKQ